MGAVQNRGEPPMMVKDLNWQPYKGQACKVVLPTKSGRWLHVYRFDRNDGVYYQVHLEKVATNWTPGTCVRSWMHIDALELQCLIAHYIRTDDDAPAGSHD